MQDRVTKYANDVLDNKIITGRYVKLACERHLKDLKRQGTSDFPYIFDVEEAHRIIDFAEELMINEGDEIIELSLYQFQCFILGSLVGWKHKDTGYRRFRASYIQLGRQNGKSLLNGILGSYIAGFDGYKNGKIGCVATNLKQSRIVWEEIQKFITADKDLVNLFKITESENLIKSKITGTKITAMSKNWKSLDGFRYILGIVDELHAHETNQFYKLVEGGQGKLKQALLSAITTAGENLNSFCKEHYDYCLKILEGLEVKETQFIYIAQMDENDDMWDYHNWIKANPLKFTDVDNNIDYDSIRVMTELASENKAKGGKDLIDFMTKQLNIWVEFTDKKYLNLANFKKCESDLTLEDVRGKSCILGLDLSSGGDLTSLALLFKLDNDELYIHSHSFIPELRVLEHEKTDLAPYRIWINEGLLTVTSGIKTDYKYIISYLQREIIDKYGIKIVACGYDNHNASAFISDLEDVTKQAIEVKQTAKELHTATEDFKLTVDAIKVKYNKDDRLLIWSFANALLSNPDSMGHQKIAKNYAQSCKRIDPCDAVIDAWHVYLTVGIPEKRNLNEKFKKDFVM